MMPVQNSLPKKSQPMVISTTSSNDNLRHMQTIATSNTHSMVTRSKIGVSKPKVYLTHFLPKPVKQALSDEK